MKKFSLLVSSAVVSLGVLANANAATQNTAGLFEVNIPNFQQNMFKVFVEGMYFQQTYGSGNYAPNSNLNGQGQVYQSINNLPGWDWGFGVGAAWYIAGTPGNDISVNYSHFGTNDDKSFAIPNNLTGTITAAVQSNIYDLSLGQNINVGKNLNARAFVGGRFANIKTVQDLSQTIAGVYTPHTSSTSAIAGGPRVGLEGIYYVWNGIGLTASASAAMLIGSVQSNLTDEGVTQGTQQTQSATQVIPNYDLRAGLNYTYQDPNWAGTVELGWRVNQFENVVPANNSVGNYGTHSQVGDVTFQGPYAKLSVVF